MENFSFLDQISISHFAKFIIAPHGAGITNAMFSKESHLIELVNEKWQKTCFAEMCERADIAYSRIDCQPSENRSLELSDINVNVSELEKELTKILK
jgi:capsular polysaccharide biosynthesis protein